MSPRPGRRRQALDEALQVALAWLSELATSERGYLRRGVRGWALREDVEANTNLFLWERLPKLATRGLLDRVDVRGPARTRPRWLYRITDAGQSAIARPGAPLRVLPELGPQDQDGGAILADGADAALVALRLAGVEGGEGADRGWRSLAALEARLATEAEARGQPVGPTLFPESLHWLVRGGLAERRDIPADAAGKRRVLWRVTDAGHRLLLLRPAGSEPPG